MPEERIQLSEQEMAELQAYADLLDMSIEDALARFSAGLEKHVASAFAQTLINKCKAQTKT